MKKIKPMAVQIIVEFDKSLFCHFTVCQWNEFMANLVRRNMTPVAWEKRPPPLGVMFDFRGLRRANYRLDGIDLTFCDLDDANFEGASLQNAKVGSCPKANLRNARLHGASFRGDVSNCDFTDAKEICEADFRHAYYYDGSPPIGLPAEVLASCEVLPPSDEDIPSVPEQPLRACVTIHEVPGDPNGK